MHLRIAESTGSRDLVPPVLDSTPEDSTVNTDELASYNVLSKCGRVRKTVNHSKREWARDDDGDGIREVHVNSIEGLWTGLRNFLRIFRGVSKNYLAQYAAVFEWRNRVKRTEPNALRELLTSRPEWVCRGTTLCRA